MYFLSSRPAWVLVLLLFVFTVLAMTGPFLVRLRVRLEQLRSNNEVAGCPAVSMTPPLPPCVAS